MIDWMKGRGQLFPLLHAMLQYCVVTATPNMGIDLIKGTGVCSVTMVTGSTPSNPVSFRQYSSQLSVYVSSSIYSSPLQTMVPLTRETNQFYN